AMQPLVMSAYNPAGLSGRAMSMGPEATLNSADGVDTTRVAVLVPASISMHGGEVTEAIQSERTEPGAGYIKAVVSCEKDLGIPSGHSSVADFNSRKSNSGKQVVLRAGSMLFAPCANTVVDTPFGRIAIDAGSLVLVIVSSDALAVYDFHDGQRNAVVITAANRTLALCPGRHATVTTDNVREIQEINAAEAFGYRNMTIKQLGAGLNVFASEFSIPTAMRMVEPLRHLAVSRHPAAAQLTKRIMKTAAVLMQTGAGSGAYQPVPRRYVTAIGDTSEMSPSP